MVTSSTQTAFAPAERASMIEVDDQAQYFQGFPLLTQLFNTLPNIFLVLNEQRQIVFANHSLLKILGLESQESVLGRRPGEALNCIHAVENDMGCGTTAFCSTCGAVRAILSSLRGVEAVEECSITQTDGNALDLRVWTNPLDVGGRQFTTFSVEDISHEKRRRILERIFFHDILNTAGGIRGFAEVLASETFGNPKLAKKEIYWLAERLIEEIRAQQELTSAENYELTVHLDSVNSKDLLEEIASLYKRHEIQRERHLEIAQDTQAVHFVTDETLLGRVISNMVKNALEASREHQTVTLSCSVEGDEIEFRVHNPGVIPQQVQFQIFQRSFSTKGSGRGLGTYSMKLLSERYLKGKVSFTSSPEEGTTFRARYPLQL